jgi:hypothetical protein
MDGISSCSSVSSSTLLLQVHDNFNLAVNLVHNDNGDLFAILRFIEIG